MFLYVKPNSYVDFLFKEYLKIQYTKKQYNQG